jgi:peptidoglycan/LPS O-acetylase OafA/YrhL
MGEQRLLAIDAARGVAAGVVFVHHLDVFYPRAFESLLGDRTIGHWLLEFVSELNVEAVMLFFIISGFCIRATSVTYDFGKLGSLLDYGRRRVARIVPLYLIALCFTFGAGVAVGQTSDESYSLGTLAGNMMFLQAPASVRGVWFIPFWW